MAEHIPKIKADEYFNDGSPSLAGKLVRAELMSIGRGLNLEVMVTRAADFLHNLLGADTGFTIVRWEGKRPVTLSLENGLLPASVSLPEIIKLLQSRKIPLILPEAQQAEELAFLPEGLHLAYYPITDTTDIRSALLVLSRRTLLSPTLLDELEAIVAILKNGMENSSEYGRVLREYSMLEMAKRTWEQLWREIEGQQKSIEKLLARNQALYDIGLAINSSLDLKDVLATIVSEAVKLMQCSRGAIALWDERSHELKVMAEHLLLGVPDEQPEFTEIDLNIGHDHDEHTEVRLPEISFPQELSELANDKLRHFLAESWELRAENSGSTIVSPLSWQKQTVGAIILNDQTAGRIFSKEDQDILALIASQAAVAIENARLFDDIREERNRTRAILDSIADGVFTTDLEQRITLANPAAEQLLGIKAAELLNKVYFEVLGVSDRQGNPVPPEASPILQAIHNSASTEPRVFRVNNQEDRQLMIALVAAPIVDSGSVSGVVGVFRDVTKEQEVSRLKDEFVSLVSHELRTPMASVLGFSELMLTRSLSEAKSRMYVETIHKEAVRLSGLINDFLDIQRMEAGRQTYNYSEVDFSLILRTVLNIFSAERERIRTFVPSDLPWLRTDPDRIVQALTNLVGNAIKYSPNGGDIEIAAYQNKEGMVEISVKDYGLGIPKEAMGQLFSKFYRVDNSDRREIGGTGLGLAISREIIEAHGGKIWLESVLGKGSTFYFTLPAVQTTDRAGGIGDRGRLEEKKRAGEDRLVLLVEDDASLGKLLSTYLEEDGLRSELINSAEEALRFLETDSPAAIVLDILLAGQMDGWDFLIKLKADKRWENIPVVICTVLDNQFIGGGLGEADFLPKPIDTHKLVESINRVTAIRPQRNILVIDDDASLRRMLKETLGSEDFVVGTAANGEQGLKLALQNSFDLIILDLMMPKMDGFQVLSRLRADRRTINVPVIVVSAKELSNEEQAFLKHRLAYFLTKRDYTPQRVRDVVRESLDLQEVKSNE